MIEAHENNIAAVEPALVGIEGAASLLGLSVTAFKQLDHLGQIGVLLQQVRQAGRQVSY